MRMNEQAGPHRLGVGLSLSRALAEIAGDVKTKEDTRRNPCEYFAGVRGDGRGGCGGVCGRLFS